MLAALLADEVPAGRVTPLLDQLVNAHVVATVRNRYHVPNAEIRAVLAALPDGSARLLRRAAEVLADTRMRLSQVERIEQLEMHFVEVDVRVRAELWLSSYELISRMHPVLYRWRATDLLLMHRESIAGNLKSPYKEMANYNAIGSIYLARGRVNDALAAFESALREASASSRHEFGRRKIYLNLAELHWQRNDIRTAREYYERALAMAQEDDDRLDRISALAGLADCNRRWGAHRDAVRLGREALSAAQAERSPQAVRIAVRLARWHSESGNGAEAERVMDVAMEEAGVHGARDATLRAQCLDGRADLALDADHLDKAEQMATRAVAEALTLHAPVTVLQARTTLALTYMRLDRLDDARKAIEGALPYQRSGRSLIVLALRALIAFRQDPDGPAARYFATLEKQSTARWKADRNDFAAAEFEGLARAAAHALQGKPIEPALDAFRRARAVVPVPPPGLEARLKYMISLLALRISPDRLDALLRAATGTVTGVKRS